MRQLATVRKIDEILPIPDADAIECAVIGGWKVVAQKGLYKVGDLAVYLEIDSWVPHTVAPFLTKNGHYPKVYEGIEGERLKTVKLRGQISQGLLLPLNSVDGKATVFSPITDEFGGCKGAIVSDGDDVTELLGILKWEKEISAQLAGRVKGNFPTRIRKTDQERIQNLVRDFTQYRDSEQPFEVTEKLDGSSMTIYLDVDGNFGVCSRNNDLCNVEGNAFWDVVNRDGLEDKFRHAAGYPPMLVDKEELRFGWAIQGELIGPGIQGNPYKLKQCEFYVFDIWDMIRAEYLPASVRRDLCSKFGFNHAPLIEPYLRFPRIYTVQDMLADAEGASKLESSATREGLVFKHAYKPHISFKAISNKYLLKHADRA